MAQSDNDGRRSEPSHNARILAEQNPSSQSTGDKPETGQDERQWTLQRIEGVIGSIA